MEGHTCLISMKGGSATATNHLVTVLPPVPPATEVTVNVDPIELGHPGDTVEWNLTAIPGITAVSMTFWAFDSSVVPNGPFRTLDITIVPSPSYKVTVKGSDNTKIRPMCYTYNFSITTLWGEYDKLLEHDPQIDYLPPPPGDGEGKRPPHHGR